MLNNSIQFKEHFSVDLCDHIRSIDISRSIHPFFLYTFHLIHACVYLWQSGDVVDLTADSIPGSLNPPQSIYGRFPCRTQFSGHTWSPLVEVTSDRVCERVHQRDSQQTVILELLAEQDIQRIATCGFSVAASPQRNIFFGLGRHWNFLISLPVLCCFL